jgi:hypothetical protein
LRSAATIELAMKFGEVAPEGRIETTRPGGRWILNPARLPVPPLGQAVAT